MTILLRYCQSLVLALWIGGMAFFSFVVAPSAFQTLPTRFLAGSMVSATLAKLHLTSYPLLVLFLLLSLLVQASRERWTVIFQRLLLGLTLGALLLSVYADFAVDRRLHAMRTHLNLTEEILADHPARLEFDRLHRKSVQLMGANIVVGLLMLGCWIKQLSPPKR